MVERIQKQQDIQTARAGEQGFKYVSASASLSLQDRFVRSDGTSAAITLTLPSVREAAGLIIDIEAVDVTNATTIQDLADDAGLTNIVLNGANEHVTLYSNGYAWRELKTGYA